MGCQVQMELKERYHLATLEWGKYDSSLEGVARTVEHFEESDRLRKSD